jgi:hypothetical protein
LVFVLPGLSGVPLGASITQPRKGQDEGLPMEGSCCET